MTYDTLLSSQGTSAHHHPAFQPNIGARRNLLGLACPVKSRVFLDNFDRVKGPVPQLLCALPRLWIPTSLKPVAIDRRAKEHVMTQAFDAHHMACTNSNGDSQVQGAAVAGVARATV